MLTEDSEKKQGTITMCPLVGWMILTTVQKFGPEDDIKETIP